jgi:hypothetical protein
MYNGIVKVIFTTSVLVGLFNNQLISEIVEHTKARKCLV